MFVIKAKRERSRNFARRSRDFAFKKRDPFIERFVKALFFAFDRFFNARLILPNFGKHVTKRARNDIDEFEEKRLVKF